MVFIHHNEFVKDIFGINRVIVYCDDYIWTCATDTLNSNKFP